MMTVFRHILLSSILLCTSFTQTFKTEREVNKVFIHCSASDYDYHDDINVIRKWHLKRGWQDVGYHFFIKRDGTIQTGRPLYMIPSSQKGYNKGSISICLHGNKKFTTRQFWSLKILCYLLDENFVSLTFHGHKEVSIKSCPNFDYERILRLKDKKIT